MKHLIALISLFQLTIFCSMANALTIVTEEFPPLNFTNNGNADGFSVEIVKEIMIRVGEDEPIQFLPWARAYNMAQSLPDVLIFSVSRTAEREHQLQWVGLLASVNWVFYTKFDSNINMITMDDAKNLDRVGVYRDSGPHHMLSASGFSNLELSDNNEQLLLKLIAGRIDALLINDIGIARLLGGINKTTHDVRPLCTVRTIDLYLAFSLGTDSAKVDRWRSAFNDLDREGFIKATWEYWRYGTGQPR